jgi:signal peptidase I
LLLVLLVLVAIASAAGRARLVVIRSGSMAPALSIGAAALVERTTPRALAVGDVISFRAPHENGAVVTHRIVRIRRGRRSIEVTTRGDANSVTDPWRLEVGDAPVWRVTAVVPWLGRLVEWAHSAYLIGIVSLAIACAHVVGVRRDRRTSVSVVR